MLLSTLIDAYGSLAFYLPSWPVITDSAILLPLHVLPSVYGQPSCLIILILPSYMSLVSYVRRRITYLFLSSYVPSILALLCCFCGILPCAAFTFFFLPVCRAVRLGRRRQRGAGGRTVRRRRLAVLPASVLVAGRGNAALGNHGRSTTSPARWSGQAAFI